MASVETVGALVAAAILIVGAAFVIQRILAPSFDLGQKMALLVYDIASLREAASAVPDNVYVLYYGTPDCKWERGTYYCQGQEISIDWLRLDAAFSQNKPSPCDNQVNMMGYESAKVEYVVNEEKRSQSSPTTVHSNDFALQKATNRENIPLYIEPRDDSVLISKQRRTFYDSLTSGLYYDKAATTPVMVEEDVGMVRILKDVMNVHSQKEESVFTSKTTTLSLTPGFRIRFYDENWGEQDLSEEEIVTDQTLRICQQRQVTSTRAMFSSQEGSEPLKNKGERLPMKGVETSVSMEGFESAKNFFPEGTGFTNDVIEPLEESGTQQVSQQPEVNYEYGASNDEGFWINEECVDLRKMTSTGFTLELNADHLETANYAWTEWCGKLDESVTYTVCANSAGTLTHDDDRIVLEKTQCTGGIGCPSHDNEADCERHGCEWNPGCTPTHYPSCNDDENTGDDPYHGCGTKDLSSVGGSPNYQQCCLETGECGLCIPMHGDADRQNNFYTGFDEWITCTHNPENPSEPGESTGCPENYCCKPDGTCTDDQDDCMLLEVST